MERKRIIIHSLWLLLLVSLFSQSALAAETVEVASPTVNVRSGPGLSYSVTGELEDGDTAVVLSEQDSWYEIRYGNETGWIASWLTIPGSNAQESQEQQIAVSSVDGLNIRTQPDLSSAVLAQMDAGDQAAVTGDSGDWFEVEYEGVSGFASKQYLTLQDAAASDAQAEDTETETGTEDQETVSENAASFEIAVNGLNVREAPSLDSGISGSVSEGEVFEVLSTEGNWVEIQLQDGSSGWVYSFYGDLSDRPAGEVASAAEETVTVLVNGTNLRAEPTTSSAVVSRLDAGAELQVTGTSDDWYQVEADGTEAWIASWVVTAEEQEAEQPANPDRKPGTLTGLDIVLDPGHGGTDGGTVGVRDTKEKDLTLKTAELLAHHLRSAGADVTLTRESDEYVDLRKRVAAGHQTSADAFISIHYDATEDPSVHGFTTYYMQDYQKELAEYVNAGLAEKVSLADRGARHGNYLVLRENRQPAILIELGFLSNMNEERIVVTDQFREQAALGLYTGIIDYFDAQLEEE